MHRGGVHTEMEKYREEMNLSGRKQSAVVQAVRTSCAAGPGSSSPLGS